MKASILFLSSIFLLLSCSRKPDEKELKFYNGLLQQEITEVNEINSRMYFFLNTYGAKRDTSVLLKTTRLLDSIQLYVNQNQLKKAVEKIVEAFDDFKTNKELHETCISNCNEIQYLDSLHTVTHDTLSNLKLRIGIYSNLKKNLRYRFQYMSGSCMPGESTNVQYQSKGYALNDTFYIIVSPHKIFNNSVDKLNFDQLEIEYLPTNPKRKNFTLIHIATKDTVAITIRRVKTNLLITTVFKEKGDYLLNGQSYIEDPMYKMHEFYSTNSIIQIR